MGTERPILFNSENVLAILADRKLQTRRVIKPQPEIDDKGWFVWQGRRPKSRHNSGYHATLPPNPSSIACQCPYGRVGDKLYVKESWGFLGTSSSMGGGKPKRKYATVIYLADNTRAEIEFNSSDEMREATPRQNIKYPTDFDKMDELDQSIIKSDLICAWWKRQKKKSPIFMSKWAARIWVRITAIRVERVQDITAANAKAEGITLVGDELVFNNKKQKQSLLKIKFSRLWDSINAKPKPVYTTKAGKKTISHYVSYPWEGIRETRTYRGKTWYVYGNPWNFVLDFKRIKKG